jgi:uncharacterized lipoprotein YddW (UPF0748 family)
MSPRKVGLLLLLSVSTLGLASGQGVGPKQEFRAAWIATVANLDWPSSQSLSAKQQQDQLIDRLDRLKEAGINAVILQVRPESDALYSSALEPWSVYLTGQQGRSPGYDPLAFAVEQAHKRGMELHAWFNPYRVWVSSRNYTRDPGSVFLTQPNWLLPVKNVVILDPGLSEVRAFVTQVIMDVVDRYDVDGVHFDDYFYPYPPNTIGVEDAATYQQRGASFASIDTWRAFNVNVMVRGVHEAIEASRPDVKFGISPFGIWKSGTPSGITGLSGATELYADAVNWMEQQWLDYLTPQLYWAFGGSQDYGKLAPWWQSKINNRHLYPGHGLYRASSATFSGTLFSASEIPNQVRFNRENGIPGSVFFRARNITSFRTGGFADTLKTDLFRNPALTPTMPWKDMTAPGLPGPLTASVWGGDSVTLEWSPPVDDPGASRAKFYAVYRVLGSSEPNWVSATEDPNNLVAVTGSTLWVDHPAVATDPYFYAVTAVSPNSIESLPSVASPTLATDIETIPPTAFRLEAPFPNPFEVRTRVRYVTPGSGRISIAVHDVLGRTVAQLVEESFATAGEHEVTWEPAALASGTYFVVMRFNGVTTGKGVTYLR